MANFHHLNFQSEIWGLPQIMNMYKSCKDLSWELLWVNMGPGQAITEIFTSINSVHNSIAWNNIVHEFEFKTWNGGWVMTWGKLITVGPCNKKYCCLQHDVYSNLRQKKTMLLYMCRWFCLPQILTPSSEPSLQSLTMLQRVSPPTHWPSSHRNSPSGQNVLVPDKT